MAQQQEDREMIYQRIIFEECNKMAQIKKLTKQKYIQEVKAALAQKIAYEAIYRPTAPPKQVDQIDQEYHPPTIFGSLCCCLYPEQNRQSFQITSHLFKLKCLRALMFWRDDFLQIRDQTLKKKKQNVQLNPLEISQQSQQIESQPDLYGPLWLSITYMIIVGLCANINNYFASIDQNAFKFNTDYLSEIIGLSIIFFLAQILIFPAVVSCMQSHVTGEQSTNLYGYSLILYFIPTMLCIIPSTQWHLYMLLSAELLKAIFLGRNFSSKVDSKKFLIYIPILIFAFLHYYLISAMFFANSAGAALSSGFDKVFHARQFIY